MTKEYNWQIINVSYAILSLASRVHLAFLCSKQPNKWTHCTTCYLLKITFTKDILLDLPVYCGNKSPDHIIQIYSDIIGERTVPLEWCCTVIMVCTEGIHEYYCGPCCSILPPTLHNLTTQSLKDYIIAVNYVGKVAKSVAEECTVQIWPMKCACISHGWCSHFLATFKDVGMLLWK